MGLQSKIDNKIDKSIIWFYVIFIAVHLLLVASFFGLKYNQTYYNVVNIGTQIFIALFLIYRFNPFRTHVLYKHDYLIFLGAGTVILLNLILTQLSIYFEKIPVIGKYLQKAAKNSNVPTIDISNNIIDISNNIF